MKISAHPQIEEVLLGAAFGTGSNKFNLVKDHETAALYIIMIMQ